MDWDIEGSTDLEVVQSFKRQELAEIIEVVTKELSKFIELAKQGKVDAGKYLASINCMYYYPASNLTGLQWLERVKDELKSPQSK